MSQRQETVNRSQKGTAHNRFFWTSTSACPRFCGDTDHMAKSKEWDGQTRMKSLPCYYIKYFVPLSLMKLLERRKLQSRKKWNGSQLAGAEQEQFLTLKQYRTWLFNIIYFLHCTYSAHGQSDSKDNGAVLDKHRLKTVIHGKSSH